MREIEVIYICCYKGDIHLAGLLVASIRRFYPDRVITLIKDCFFGDFDTSELEKAWNVSVFPTQQRKFRMDFGKLEPLFLPEKKRFLMLDADIVFAGPVLESLEELDEDFVFQAEKCPDRAKVDELYFAVDLLREYDQSFSVPEYVFNFGQFVGTGGIYAREDFDAFIEWGNPPKLRVAGVFKLGLQGFMNYWVSRQKNGGKAGFRAFRFMLSPSDPEFMEIRTDAIESGSAPALLMHWCGFHSALLGGLPNGGILLNFEDLYFSRIHFGLVKKWMRRIGSFALYFCRKILARMPLLWRWVGAMRCLGASK